MKSERLLPRCYAPAGQTWENFNPPGQCCAMVSDYALEVWVAGTVLVYKRILNESYRSLGCRYGFSLQKDILNESYRSLGCRYGFSLQKDILNES